MKRLFLASAAFLAVFPLMAALTLQEKNGKISVLRDGKKLVSSAVWETGKKIPASAIKSESGTLPDGTKYFEQWCEDVNNRFRFEAAQRPDGAIELTVTGESPATGKNLSRYLELILPEKVFSGKFYQALSGNGRNYVPVKGMWLPGKKELCRWLAFDGITYDFNPLGAVDYCSGYTQGAVKGVWIVKSTGKKLILRGGSTTGKFGSFTGAKIVIREGKFKDYDKFHAIRQFRYSQHLKPFRVFAFGASKTGKAYRKGNLSYTAKRGFGWTTPVPEAVADSPEGAYYGHVSGKEKGVFKVSGLIDGVYILTAGAGNFKNVPNKFSIRVNGEPFAENISVPDGKAGIFSKAVRITGGNAEFQFEGSWILSSIGVQPLMADGEDFCVRRGFWVKDGYEPASIFRNSDYKAKAVFPLSKQIITLPVPGKEMCAKPKQPPRPVLLPDPNRPALAWLKNANMGRILSNSATLDEVSNPEVLKQYLDSETKGRNYNALMISGMHSRHTYFNHLERGKKVLKAVAEEAHKRGLKLIDHHDATLLWDSNALRVLSERLPEVSVAFADQLPSFQFCPENPVFRETYFSYLTDLVKNGIDGFQIDELCYWPAGCSCQHCRESFFRETGCQLPMNELDKNLFNIQSPLWKCYITWYYAKTANWFVELRERTKKYNPDLVLCNYTTHWGYTCSHPRNKAKSTRDELGRAVNFFGTEIMTRNVIQSGRSLIPYRKMNNYLNLAYNTPIWGWYYCSDWQSNYFAWGAGALTGQSALLNPVPVTKDMPPFQEFGSSGEVMEKEGVVHVTKAALLFSTASRDWNSLMGYEGELFGLAQTLERMHLPYEFLGDMSLDAKHLSKYKVLAIGASGCLSDAHIREIKDFVRNGGTVYMTAIAGLFDEVGNYREAWPFRDIFQFSPDTKLVKLSSFSVGKEKIKPLQPVISAMTEARRNGNISTVANYGRGKFIYSPLAMGAPFYMKEITPPQKWNFVLDEKLEKIYRQELRKVFAPADFVKTELPDNVYITLWKEKDNDLVIHLLNGMGRGLKRGTEVTPNAPSPAFPKVTKDLSVTLPGKLKSAYAVSPDFKGRKELVLKDDGNGNTTIQIPKELFSVYTLIRVREGGKNVY